MIKAAYHMKKGSVAVVSKIEAGDAAHKGTEAILQLQDRGTVVLETQLGIQICNALQETAENNKFSEVLI